MKITDISADKNEVQSFETLSDKEAIKIVGGDRGGPSDGCPPMVGHAGSVLSMGEMIRDESKGNNIFTSLSLTIRKHSYQSNKT